MKQPMEAFLGGEGPLRSQLDSDWTTLRGIAGMVEEVREDRQDADMARSPGWTAIALDCMQERASGSVASSAKHSPRRWEGGSRGIL